MCPGGVESEKIVILGLDAVTSPSPKHRGCVSSAGTGNVKEHSDSHRQSDERATFIEKDRPAEADKKH